MKMNIKIFTVLMLALTTMPGLAETCPWDAVGTYPKCNCNSGKHEVPKNSSSHYIQYNSKDGRNQCDEWIELLDSDCIHQGSAPEIRNYNKKNIPQKGKCLVFGDKEETRRQVRTLVKNYNMEIKKKRALPTGTNNAIIFGNQAEVYKWEGRDGKEGQPSIKAIIRGYTALCKRNGDGFEFKRIESGNTTSYVCQETKAFEQTAQQSTEQTTAQTSLQTTSLTTENMSNTDVCANPDKSGKICVYDLVTETNKAYQFNIKLPTSRKKDIKSIVYKYNQIAMQKNFVLPIPSVIEIVDSKMNNASPYRNTLEQEESIKAVIEGYRRLCARNEDYNGISETEFIVDRLTAYGRTCRVRYCNETTHTKNEAKGICEPKPRTEIESGKLQPTNENVTIKWHPNFPSAALGNHIDVPVEHTQDDIVTKWILNSNAAIAAADGANETEETTNSNGETVYTCIITRCKDPNKAPNEDGTACIDTTKLKPDDAVLNPVAVNAGDVKIKAPAKIPLTQKDCDKYNMILDNGVCRERTAEEEKKKFSGLVVDENGEPLIGVTIQNISNPNEGTVTDFDGNFSCELTGGENPKVRISYVGYKPQEVTLGPDPARVQLVPESQTIDEIPVVDKIPESMQKCIDSGGEWITGNTEKGENSYCECNEKILDNGVCRERTAEEACDYEGGTWTGTTCDCPEGEEWKVQYEQCVAKSEETETNCFSLHPTDISARACCEAEKSGIAQWISPTNSCQCTDKSKQWNGTTCEEKASAADEQAPKENKCDDQSNDVQHMITVIDQKLKDESNEEYIEHSISYTSCDTLTKTWTEKCKEINKKAVIEKNPDDTLKLTCVPKEDSEVEENNESDFDAIVQAFEERAKQLKDQKCGQQQ